MEKKDRQIFCADADMCAIMVKCNRRNKWELRGLSRISETGVALYESRLFSDSEFFAGGEFDAVEPVNTTSGHTHISVLQDNAWYKIVLTENKKAPGEPIEPMWATHYIPAPSGKRHDLHIILQLSFGNEDENESIESLVNRGAGENQAILIDQINVAGSYYSQHFHERNKRLMAIIDYFLKNGIDVNAKNETGQTALMEAAHSIDGGADIVRMLLQNGAKINEKADFGSTALRYACRNLNLETVEILLENGAEVDPECFLGIFYRHDLYYVDEVQTQIELAQLLLKKNKNIDVNIRDREGKTVLMDIASSIGTDWYTYSEPDDLFIEAKVELIQYLLDIGVDINAQDNEGETALMYYTEQRIDKRLTACLLDHDPDANIKDNEGNTVLRRLLKFRMNK